MKSFERFQLRRLGIATAALLGAAFLSPIGAGAGQEQVAARGTSEQVQNGTRFLVRLDREMNTGKDRLNQRFDVRTLEPLETSRGRVVPAGARITGHISRIEPAGLTGRARVWLTFDDIDTRHGTFPIVAEVYSVPGEYSVRQGETKEGEIEARTSKGSQVAEATAGGAMMGSARGVATHNNKAAAEGAAVGGVAAFLAASGLGQELDLPKGAKLELVLDRPLFLNQ